MRKIEEQMIQAIRRNKTWWRDNTTVAWKGVSNDQALVLLFNNLIAQIKQPDSSEQILAVWHQGWETRTTMDRLDALLREFSPFRVRPAIRQHRAVLVCPEDSPVPWQAPLIIEPNYWYESTKAWNKLRGE